MTFTAQQINNWREYERVRKSGRWNMFDQQARWATGLSGEDYLYVMKNFDALEKAAQGEKA